MTRPTLENTILQFFEGPRFMTLRLKTENVDMKKD